MGWPTPQDYHEAIQNPHLNLGDDELREGTTELSSLGLPKVSSGAFASVYRVRCKTRDVAVRCFLQNIADQEWRYAKISDFVMADDLESTVAFEYVPRGILVHGSWFPILKMEWVPGTSLDSYVRNNVNDAQAISSLVDRFSTMVQTLKEAGIAHGDLQHGNIMVLADGNLRLVDYDGMFVPALAGNQSNELGHRNYQHPARNKVDFAQYLDNFSAWSIHASLSCLRLDSSLYDRLGAGDECLLFRQADYRYPMKSRAFHVLEQHEIDEIRLAAKRLRALACQKVPDVCYLGEPFAVPEDLPALPEVFEEEQISAPKPLFAQSKETTGLSIAIPGDYWLDPGLVVGSIRASGHGFADAQLRQSRAELVGGELAYVQTADSMILRFDDNEHAYSVKIWLREDATRARHYADLVNYIQTLPPTVQKYFTHFEYQQQGLQVFGNWYPILKMQRLIGQPLDAFVGMSPGRFLLGCISDRFRQMIVELRREKIIHGNLEASNLVWSDANSEIHMVDYDSMWTPNMSGQPLFQLHPNYRHPDPSSGSPADNENFAAWVLDTTMFILSRQPDLISLLHKDRFLFGASDFEHPDHSFVFAKLSSSEHPAVRNRGQLLKLFCRTRLCDIPPLAEKAVVPAAFAREHHLDFPSDVEGYVTPDVPDTEQSYATSQLSVPPAGALTTADTDPEALVRHGLIATAALGLFLACTSAGPVGVCLIMVAALLFIFNRATERP